jgi:hypothetical protein
MRRNHAVTTQKDAAWFENALGKPRNHAVPANHAGTTRVLAEWFTLGRFAEPRRKVFETAKGGAE